MAGKVSAKGAVITLNSQNISKDVVSYTIEYGNNPVDVTGFTDGTQNFIPGLPVTGFTLDVLWNTTAVTGATTVIKAMIATPATGFTCSIVPEAAALTLSGNFMCDGIHPTGAPGDAISMGSCHFSVQGSTAPSWA